VRVKNWMTRSAPIIREDSNVGEALKVMNLYGVRELAVVNEEGQYMGVLNKEDIIKQQPEKGIKDFLVFGELFLHPEDTIEAVFLAFMETSEEFVPVVDEDLKVVGMITLQDVIESMIEITAMDEPGCRISLLLEDMPGKLSNAVKVLSENGFNILSILTYREEENKRRVVIKVSAPDCESVEEVLVKSNIEYDSLIKEEGF